MTRDWFWPWWASTLFDLGVVVVAVVVFWLSARRWVRWAAAGFVVAGLTAAVLAPVVMKEREASEQPMQPRPMTTVTSMEP